MDVEGHNIANVNTVGFKYARANFGDMLSQTVKIATAPQGNMGGKNDLQVGLGSMITSTTRIFKQGSTQDTGKNTDLAIQGDGFFVVTADGGQTYKFTRNGDFNLDANGNLVDNNGMVVQGWRKEIQGSDESCGGENDANLVDSTQPISNIEIQPGLKIPAKKTGNIQLKANLNGGQIVENKTCIYETNAKDGLMYAKSAMSLDTIPSPDMAGLFDEFGHRFDLTDGEGSRIRIIDPSNSKNYIDIDLIYSNSYDPNSMDVKAEKWVSTQLQGDQKYTPKTIRFKGLLPLSAKLISKFLNSL
jgi:flagellar hook protein FlgE